MLLEIRELIWFQFLPSCHSDASNSRDRFLSGGLCGKLLSQGYQQIGNYTVQKMYLSGSVEDV